MSILPFSLFGSHPNTEWDPEKNARNIAKHGISFEDAVRIFDGKVLETPDTRKDYGEDRFLACGMMDGRETIVVYTKRGSRRRIISARRARIYERQAYHQAFFGTQKAEGKN